MTPLERITERVNREGDVNDASTPRPLLTLEEFFDGNDVVGCIGPNLTPVAEPSDFCDSLKDIANRENVADVRVQITEFDDPESWPFSDVVWVITNAEPEEVKSWFDEGLRPDECWSGWTTGILFEPCLVPPGMKPVACWWD
jgi:hypothetical protein